MVLKVGADFCLWRVFIYLNRTQVNVIRNTVSKDIEYKYMIIKVLRKNLILSCAIFNVLFLNVKEDNTMRNKHKEKQRQTKTAQKRVSLFIDEENISPKKAESIVMFARRQGALCSARGYGLQDDEHIKHWTLEAKLHGIQEVRLPGKPKKDKIDKRIQDDVIKMNVSKNGDIVCIVTSDRGYIPTIEQLKKMGKRVVGMGEAKAPYDLRNACDEFIQI